MRKVLASIALTTMLVPAAAGVAQAKKKKYSPPTSSGQVNGNRHDDGGKIPPPGDKRTNEGAQGRVNATEDAARDADSAQFGTGGAGR